MLAPSAGTAYTSWAPRPFRASSEHNLRWPIIVGSFNCRHYCWWRQFHFRSCHQRCDETWSMLVLPAGSRSVIPDIKSCATEPSSCNHQVNLNSGWFSAARSAISNDPLMALHHFRMCIQIKPPKVSIVRFSPIIMFFLQYFSQPSKNFWYFLSLRECCMMTS